MATTAKTQELLRQLDVIDEREDLILEVLLKRGSRMQRVVDEAERRNRVVTIDDLRGVREGLGGIETVIDELQHRIERAEAAATPAMGNAGAAAPGAAGAPAPTFDQIAAGMLERNAESDRLRAMLRERLTALEPVDASTPVPGEPADAPRTFRLRKKPKKPMSGSDVRRFQRDLNRRLAKWKIGIRIREDGRYGEQTRLAARRVARGLGVSPADLTRGVTPQLRSLIHDPPGRRSPEQLERARRMRPWLARLRRRYPRTDKPKPGSTRGLAAAIDAKGGRYGQIIVREAKRSGLPVSLLCAVIDVESDFRNIFGRDSGPENTNPVKSPPAPRVLQVDKQQYDKYLRHRNRKLGKNNQGVGPMQLTWHTLQDGADLLGGCWKPQANIRFGAAHLAALIDKHGRNEGLLRYNGGSKYPGKVLEAKRLWNQRLAGAATTPSRPPKPKPGGGATSKPGRPRTLRLAPRHMHGNDVRAWQRTLNRQMKTWRVNYRIEVDGDYGAATRDLTATVLHGLGIAATAMERGVTPELRRKVRHKRLTVAERGRFAARRGWRLRLGKRHADGGSVAPPLADIKSSSWGWNPGHDGVDLICRADAPIFAICDARVIDVRSSGWWGKGAKPSPGHPVSDGDGIIQLECLVNAGPFRKGMHFGYGHAEHATVKVGQTVKAGRRIGRAGYANAAHVHFMANGGGTSKGVGDRDPMPYVKYALRKR